MSSSYLKKIAVNENTAVWSTIEMPLNLHINQINMERKCDLGGFCIVIVISPLWLAIVLLDMLGHREARVDELLDVGDIVVLSSIHSEGRAQQEREGALDQAHWRRLETSRSAKTTIWRERERARRWVTQMVYEGLIN
ncbi:hypothetical protein SAY87_020542 [Trapa incisa]|uniref:Uncharacterized protein n=1 Tax=Trapa incisa TaxID=236973 RepID=A0AAN7PPA5_9MYRT|nr:hypothetical protein SAY87_020542 [Trapa incisa]